MRDDQGLSALAELAEPLRRRIYDFVAESRSALSKDDVARAVGIGRSLAAYHLDRLLTAGFLTASYARKTGRSGPGAGRTAKLYAVSDRQFGASVPPRDYEQMGRLLAEAVERDESGAAQAAAEQAAYEEGRNTGRDNRETTTADALRNRGFRPFCDEDDVVRLANCPFDRLAQEHRQLVCAVNHAFIRGLIEGLGAELRAELDPRPGLCCVAVHRASPA